MHRMPARRRTRAAPQSFLDTDPNIGTRYAAAPHVFSFTAQGLATQSNPTC